MNKPAPTPLARIDLGITGGAPTIRAWTVDGTEHTYPLTPPEAAALLKRLAGHLQALLIDRAVDRTDDSHQANPELYERDDLPEAS